MNDTVITPLNYNDFEDSIAVGYSYDGTSPVQKPDDIYNLYPAGAAKSTAQDMARYMIALVNDGKYNNSTILEPSTIDEMFTPTFTPYPSVSSLSHGFWNGNYKGIEYTGHGGDTFYFHTMLTIIDELDLGLFISCNEEASYLLSTTFYKEFVDEFYSDIMVVNDQPQIDIDLSRFTGAYTSGRSPITTNAKIVNPLSCILIMENDDGTLLFREDTLVPIDDFIFRNQNDSSLVIFAQDIDGRILNMYLENAPAIYYIKDKPLQNSIMYLVVLAFAVIVFLLSIIIWLIKKVISLIKKRTYYT